MAELDLNQASKRDIETIAALERASGVVLSDCYQCGKCSAGCPFVLAMDIPPHRIMRYLQLQQLQPVLNAKTPWLCANCHTCTSRCPHQVRISFLMESIKQEAKRQKRIGVREVNIFSELFMKTVYFFGRSHEVLMTGLYNFTSLHFLQDVPNAPEMFLKGKIHLLPHMTKNRQQVRRLIDNYKKHAKQRGEKR